MAHEFEEFWVASQGAAVMEATRQNQLEEEQRLEALYVDAELEAFDQWVDSTIVTPASIEYLRTYVPPKPVIAIVDPVELVYELPFELGPTTIVTEQVRMNVPLLPPMQLNQPGNVVMGIMQLEYRGKLLARWKMALPTNRQVMDRLAYWCVRGVAVRALVMQGPGAGRRVEARPRGAMLPGADEQRRDSFWNSPLDWLDEQFDRMRI